LFAKAPEPVTSPTSTVLPRDASAMRPLTSSGT
jgi:hypothetical protein